MEIIYLCLLMGALVVLFFSIKWAMVAFQYIIKPLTSSSRDTKALVAERGTDALVSSNENIRSYVQRQLLRVRVVSYDIASEIGRHSYGLYRSLICGEWYRYMGSLKLLLARELVQDCCAVLKHIVMEQKQQELSGLITSMNEIRQMHNGVKKLVDLKSEFGHELFTLFAKKIGKEASEAALAKTLATNAAELVKENTSIERPYPISSASEQHAQPQSIFDRGSNEVGPLVIRKSDIQKLSEADLWAVMDQTVSYIANNQYHKIKVSLDADDYNLFIIKNKEVRFECFYIQSIDADFVCAPPKLSIGEFFSKNRKITRHWNEACNTVVDPYSELSEYTNNIDAEIVRQEAMLATQNYHREVHNNLAFLEDESAVKTSPAGSRF